MTPDVLIQSRTQDAVRIAQQMRAEGVPPLDVLRWLVVFEEVATGLRGAA